MTDWQVEQRYTALARTVIAVATTRIEGTWAAYIASVPGVKHDHEWRRVLEYGDKLPEDIAKAIFPDFVGKGAYSL